MAAVTSCANALLIRKEEENSHLCAGMLMNMSSTVCPPKKYPYNNRIISIEGTFFWDTLYNCFFLFVIRGKAIRFVILSFRK
jgi:hypothetical protein